MYSLDYIEGEKVKKKLSFKIESDRKIETLRKYTKTSPPSLPRLTSRCSDLILNSSSFPRGA